MFLRRDLRQRADYFATEQTQTAPNPLQLVFDNAPIGMLVKDIGSQLLQANKALQHMLGYDAEEFTRIGMPGLVSLDDRALWDALCMELVSGKRDSYQIETRYLHKDGHDVWCKADVSLVRDEHGKPQLAIVLLEDISVRKRFDASRKRMISRYEQVLNTAGWGVCEVDRHGALAFVNSVAARMLGWSVDDLIGQPVWVIHQTHGAAMGWRQDERPIYGALRDGLTRHRDRDIFHCKDGSSILVEYTVMPIIESGSASSVVITFMSMGTA